MIFWLCPINLSLLSYLIAITPSPISSYRTMEGDTTQLGAKLKDAGAI